MSECKIDCPNKSRREWRKDYAVCTRNDAEKWTTRNVCPDSINMTGRQFEDRYLIACQSEVRQANDVIAKIVDDVVESTKGIEPSDERRYQIACRLKPLLPREMSILAAVDTWQRCRTYLNKGIET